MFSDWLGDLKISLPTPGKRIVIQQPQSPPVMGRPQMVAPAGPSSLGLTMESFAALNKNPVSALMEYAQSRHGTARIDVMCQKGPSHRPRYL